MSEEYKIIKSINERVGVCEYKGRILSFEYERLQNEGVPYLEGMYQLQKDFSRRLEQGRKEEEERRKSMTPEQLKARDEANRIFQDRMNEEAKTNAKLSKNEY
jgi:hypothetical protein